MTKKELKELIKSSIQEYMGTGSSGGNAGDGNSIKSQRMGGGSFKTDEDEIEFYKGQNVGDGGQGQQTKGMEAVTPGTPKGNPNRTRFTRF